MNFEDEHYVRIYTRDTRTWLRWGWEGQTVFCLLDRKLDKSGILDVDEDPADDVALVTGLPVEVVEVGLPRLLKSGTLELRDGKLICPRYVEANTAKKSNAARAKEYRERKNAEARSSATNRDDNERDAESCDDSSQTVTATTQNVPPSHESSLKSRAVQEQSRADTPQPPKGPIACPPDLRLTPDQVSMLEVDGIFAWAVEAITRDRVASWISDSEEKKTLPNWRKYLLATIRRVWTDPAKRPKPPDDPDGRERKRQANLERARLAFEKQDRERELAAQKAVGGDA